VLDGLSALKIRGFLSRPVAELRKIVFYFSFAIQLFRRVRYAPRRRGMQVNLRHERLSAIMLHTADCYAGSMTDKRDTGLLAVWAWLKAMLGFKTKIPANRFYFRLFRVVCGSYVFFQFVPPPVFVKISA